MSTTGSRLYGKTSQRVSVRISFASFISAFRSRQSHGTDGGHYERKMKHLQKQKEGKKRLRAMSIGNVELPQEAFSAVRLAFRFSFFARLGTDLVCLTR